MKILDIFKKKSASWRTTLTVKTVLNEPQPNRQPAVMCHYCCHMIDLSKVKIVPVQVPLLYSNVTTEGKGTICPNCKRICIVG
jgi:hypothetical protein